MNATLPATWRLTRLDALVIEEAVSRELLVSVADLRRFFGEAISPEPERFDDAVRLLLDERRVCGFCDRDTSTLLSTEHVDFICFLAPKVA